MRYHELMRIEPFGVELTHSLPFSEIWTRLPNAFTIL
jgi:hypothetical protein